MDKLTSASYKKAAFAAGCFWGVEASFRKHKGVLSTRVGYAGGSLANPTYKQVCTGTTGHAEAVEVEYDARIVSYEELLELFWSLHDPTTPNRAGPDVGTQYRSIIFYFDEQQKQAALLSKEHQAQKYRRPIVTEIIPAASFYAAEEYHQCYLEKRERG